MKTPKRRPILAPVLIPGDIAPDFVLPDLEGEKVDLRCDAIAGNAVVLMFLPRFSAGVREALGALRANLNAFMSARARLFAVTLAPAALVAEQEVPITTLLDGDAQLPWRWWPSKGPPPSSRRQVAAAEPRRMETMTRRH